VIADKKLSEPQEMFIAVAAEISHLAEPTLPGAAGREARNVPQRGTTRTSPSACSRFMTRWITPGLTS